MDSKSSHRTCPLNALLIPFVGPIFRVGRHSTATRGGGRFMNQSDARVLSGRERDYATIKNPSRLHRRIPLLILSKNPNTWIHEGEARWHSKPERSDVALLSKLIFYLLHFFRHLFVKLAFDTSYEARCSSLIRIASRLDLDALLFGFFRCPIDKCIQHFRHRE